MTEKTNPGGHSDTTSYNRGGAVVAFDDLGRAAAWSSETVDWTTDIPPFGLRVDPLSGEPVIFHYAPLRPVPTDRLMRKQP